MYVWGGMTVTYASLPIILRETLKILLYNFWKYIKPIHDLPELLVAQGFLCLLVSLQDPVTTIYFCTFRTSFNRPS